MFKLTHYRLSQSWRVGSWFGRFKEEMQEEILQIHG
jgi:hypothetical protein